MKRIGMFFLLTVCGYHAGSPQNIRVTFSGNNVVDSVKATNLTTLKSISLPGDDTLLLSATTDVPWVSEFSGTGLIYPNPFYGTATLLCSVATPQWIRINLLTMTGQSVAKTVDFIDAGENRFAFSVKSPGIYVITISCDQGSYSYKALCAESFEPASKIQYAGTSDNHNNHNNQNFSLKSRSSQYILGYQIGEIILYRCYSGNNSTVFTDSPSSSKNYEVEFIECSDRDGKNYPVVKIGGRFWMAENLAYLPSVSTSSSVNVSTGQYYVYGYDGGYAGNAKKTKNYTTYGVLYNWPAAIKSCPAGWHLPLKSEWNDMLAKLGPSPSAGNSLKETGADHWAGNNREATNKTGFTALPGGELYPFVSGNMGFTVSPGFISLGQSANFWTQSEEKLSMFPATLSAWYIALKYNSGGYGWSSEHGYTITHNYYPSQNTKGSGYSVRCVYGKSATAPVVNTADISQITDSSAQGGGVIVNDGGLVISRKGICWSEDSLPTIDDKSTNEGSGDDTYSSQLTGLITNTIYHVRAYAVNEIGTSYGNDISFKTSPGLPVASTTLVIRILDHSTQIGGEITNDGGSDVTARGICWSVTPLPTLQDQRTQEGSGKGKFLSTVGELQTNTRYYARAYATNRLGTGYGKMITFRTAQGAIMFHEKLYGYIAIGSQTWMNENLAYLPEVSPGDSESVFEPRYYVYDYNGDKVSEALATENYGLYGVLYNRQAVMAGAPSSERVPSGVRGICPEGWHLPSDEEIQMLISTVGGEAASLKSVHGWKDGENGNDISGFNALPGGARYSFGFYFGREMARVWTTSSNVAGNAISMDISSYADNSDVEPGMGLSVRCLKNKSGENSLPIANLSTGTDLGLPGSAFRFDASGSYDSETTDSELWFRWDWENDGTWDTENSHESRITHGYITPGNYRVLVEVTDEAGARDTSSLLITIADGSFTDGRDGNTYAFVKIGTQTWMAENLKHLPSVNTPFQTSQTAARYYVNGNWTTDVNEAVQNPNYLNYGTLYNREASRTACPEGWHLPSDYEWMKLEKYLGMADSDAQKWEWRESGQVGSKLKSASGWSYRGNGNNSSRFRVLPAGYLLDSGSSTVADPGMTADFWTSSNETVSRTYRRRLIYLNDAVFKYPEINSSGFSIRCVKEQ